MADSDPLTEQDFETLTRGLGLLDEADRQIERAKRAGIPIQEADKTSTEQREQIRRILNTYFPGRLSGVRPIK